ncbi:GNAT family N-acetyltransferase [Microlunatus elymi]|uniref:GNAT family N-acetyltransferase n=1 Tax=Microlunatus elymi TaxID=2596828 RepID=A0A516Q341_9ACTN|nr:GNAT family N-acetyltransferase [Microlunatus elymi]QDP97846.1 GNAT family N-acetyltransferase [Microlunatus elymi]
MDQTPPRAIGADALSAMVPPLGIDDRVTIRYRLTDGSATDVVGWVVGLDDDQVRVQPPAPDGRPQPALVDRDRIILAKRVPPVPGGRPVSRTTAEELERIAMQGWIDESAPLLPGHHGWTLRFGNGFTGRANSCLAVGDPGLPYPEASKLIIEQYQAAGLPPWVQVITDSVPDRRLVDLGWQPTYVPTTVMTGTLGAVVGDHRRTDRVQVAEQLTEDWWQGYLQYRPIPDHETARRILINNPPVGLASVHHDGRLVALGRGQITADWLGIAGLWTDPAFRRQGLATMIIRELAHWAARRGARYGYLQVAQENAGAIAAYSRLGFVRHHDYRYLAPAPV